MVLVELVEVVDDNCLLGQEYQVVVVMALVQLDGFPNHLKVIPNFHGVCRSKL